MKKFITSKGTGLFPTVFEMENHPWFNIWQKLHFPYEELSKGDLIYWLDTIQKKIVWKTEVINVTHFQYFNKSEIEKYKSAMTPKYFAERKDKGYFLGYEIKVREKLDVPKPAYKFDQLGWERVDNDNFNRWFGDNLTLDNYVDEQKKNLSDKIIKLNDSMKFISPQKIKKLVLATLRNDTHFVKLLKEAADFRCQFPNCGHQIKTKQGTFYIEVAHIESVKNDGKSALGNLVVLCPNHHKEFDYGEREIIEQTVNRLSGTLNGKAFTISFDQSKAQ